MADALTIVPLGPLPEFGRRDDLAAALAAAVTKCAGGLEDHDVVAVTSKIVSKVEGRVVPIDEADPGAKQALVHDEAVRVLRRRDELMICETHHGLVCANAGVDLSNVPTGEAALLPTDPDHSARGLRDRLAHAFGLEALGVVVTDTFGRPWRRGVTDVAIGAAGFAPVRDLRGTVDSAGRELEVTEVGVADEIAAAADLVMGKTSGVPAALVRGLTLAGDGAAADTVRPTQEDLFR